MRIFFDAKILFSAEQPQRPDVIRRGSRHPPARAGGLLWGERFRQEGSGVWHGLGFPI